MASASDAATDAPSVEKPGADKPGARAVGRGGVAVLGAKVFFVLSGLVQQTLLPRVIGLAGYGALSRVLAIANVLNNVTVSSSTQGVSRAVAAAGKDERQALRATLRLHVPLAVALATAFFLASPLAARFESAPYIARPLEVMAGVVLVYGCYAPLIGALNGRALFTRQAGLDTLFATLRTSGMLGVGYLFQARWGEGLLGACVGFVGATLVILPLAVRWAGVGERVASPRPSTVPSASVYLFGLGQLALAQFFTNALMQSDITLLGRFLSLSAVGTGLGGEAAAKSADEWVAVYRACQLFAFLPYQLVLSISQILFPMVARAHSAGDDEAVRTYVERGARLGAIACGLLVGVVATLPGSVLHFAYGAVVAERGASTLRVLALGQGAFTLFGLATTVLASLRKEWISLVLSVLAVLSVAAACWFTAKDAPFGEAQLAATALATSAVLVLGLLGASAAVKKHAGGFLPWKTSARVATVVLLLAYAGTHVPRLGRVLTPVAAVVVVTVYLVLLVVTGELSRGDLDALRGMVAKKRG